MKPTNILDQLARDEGCVLHTYPDKKSVPTLGVGHNVLAHGLPAGALPVPPSFYNDAYPAEWLIANRQYLATITREIAMSTLTEDLIQSDRRLYHLLPWIENLPLVRREAIRNMSFNMGPDGVFGFKHALEALASGDWKLAAKHLADSLWYHQVEERAVRLCKQIETGEWQ